MVNREQANTGEENRARMRSSIRSSGFELVFGPIATVLLVGCFIGAIFGAYYLGFLAGRGFGFENARQASRVEVAKVPVFDEPVNELDQVEVLSELNEVVKIPGNQDADQLPIAKKSDSKSSEFDSLADSSPSSENKDSETKHRQTKGSEAEEELGAEDFGEQDLDTEPALEIKDLRNNPKEQDKKEPSSLTTLGDLIEERVALAKPTVAVAATVSVSNKDQSNSKTQANIKPTAIADKKLLEKAKTQTQSAQPTSIPKETPKPLKVVEDKDGVRQVIPKGWFAQVAAPKKLAEAQTAAKKLRNAGFRVMIENAHVRGEDYYRIVVGPESDRVLAERLVEQLVREKVVSGRPFIRRVN